MAVKRKVVLLGDSAVGKTGLTRLSVFDHLEDYCAAIPPGGCQSLRGAMFQA